MRTQFLALACSLVLSAGGASAQQRAPSGAPVVLGEGAQRYEWVAGWLELPEKQELGNTHGAIVVDAQGQVYLNTDTSRAVMVYSREGKYLRSFGADLAGGVHGMTLVREGGEEFLYLVHQQKNEARKLTLAGETLWTLPYPAESGRYASAGEYHPTGIAIAPGGEIFLADGYGKSWVHRYSRERKYLGSFGGPGDEPGQFHCPHGIAVDPRTSPPTLLVADRENHRLQRFDLEGRFLGSVGGFRRPCSVDVRGEYAVVADLAGRVTILDGRNEIVAHLGDNPDPKLRAENGVPREKWQDGLFTAPHFARWDAEGNLYVMDWNHLGRVNKLRPLKG